MTNHSDTPTDCSVKFSSHFETVTISPSRCSLSPRSSALIHIQVQPKQLNPNYHKLVTIVNENNPNNTLSLLIRSANILDTHGVRFHSQYYEIYNPFIGPTPGLPVGFQEVNGKIKAIDDEFTDRRKLKEISDDSSLEAIIPTAPPLDDSDLLPTSSDPHNADIEGATSRSSGTSPIPPISPSSDHTLLQHSNSSATTPIHSILSGPIPITSIPSSLPSASLPSMSRATSDLTQSHNHPTNVIPLGTLVCHHPIVRVFEIRNITHSRLVLKLSTSLDSDRPNSNTDVSEMRLFVRNEKFFQSQTNSVDPSASASPSESSTPSSTTSPLTTAMSASLTSFAGFPLPSPSPTASGSHHLIPFPSLTPSANLSSHVLDAWSRFMSTLLSGDHTALSYRFADLASERSFVKRFILQRRDLDIVFKERIIIPIEEANVSARDGASSDTNLRYIELAPLETKQVFVYINMQNQLPVRTAPKSTAASASPPPPPPLPFDATSPLPPVSPIPSTPLSVTFMNKDFLKNKLIRLDEREIQIRDTQTSLSIHNEPTSVSHELASASASSIQSLSSSISLTSANSNEALESILLTHPSISPKVSSNTLSEAGLKVFIQLVEYPVSQGANSLGPSTPVAPSNSLPPLPPPALPHSLVQASSDSTPSSSPIIRASFPVNTPLPLRTLLFPAYLCRSALEVAQKHINFGQLLNMDVHSKTLVLSNLSEVPLLFMVKQTGSIASLDLTFPKGDIGVIPPQGYTDLPFLFKPSLAGKFLEPITILNVEDTTNSRVINVKAYLRKPVHFWIQNLNLDFKICCSPTTTTQAETQSDASLIPTPARRPSLTSAISPSPAPVTASSLISSISSIPSAIRSSQPILTSTQRIVIKNISLKARTFKIQLIDWEKKMVKMRATVSVNSLDTALNSDAMAEHLSTPPEPSQSSSNDTPIVTYYLPDECPPELNLSCIPSLTLKLEDVALGASLSVFEREEEEEKLNHKLRIAIRKKKLDKVEKIRNRLSELRDMKMERHTATHGHSSNSNGDSAQSSNKSCDKSHPHTESHDSYEGIIFTLEPNAVQNVRATFTPTWASEQTPSTPMPSFIEFYTGLIHVFETKNKEIIEEVKCSVAVCSDVSTQEDYLANTSKWTAEEVVDAEDEMTEEADAEVDENGNMDELATISSTNLTDPNQIRSPHSAEPYLSPPKLTHLDTFIRAKSLPIIDDDGPLPDANEDVVLPLLSEPASLGPRSTLTGDLKSPGHETSPDPSSNTSVTARLALTLPTLFPIVSNATVNQLLLTAPSTMPSSLLSTLQTPSQFPSYSSSTSTPDIIQQALHSHAKFYHMLYEKNGASNGPMSTPVPLPLPPSRPSVHLGLSDFSLPFSTGVPLEYVSSRSLKSESACLPSVRPTRIPSPKSRINRTASEATFAASASSPSTQSNVPIFSPFRLIAGTSAAIFRVYIEDQIPISLPSPSFFTLNSHVPSAMIIEIKWVPHFDDDIYSYSHHSLPNGLDSTFRHNGGFMRVFVKPGTSLLTTSQHTEDTVTPMSPASVTRMRSASSLHTLPHRTHSFGPADSAHSTPPHHHSLAPTIPSLNGPHPLIPTTSLYVLLPAHGELDIFMCWLSSLASWSASHLGASRQSRIKQLRRSSSSMTGVGLQANGNHATNNGAGHDAEHLHNPSHRWKKGLSLIHADLTQEALLLPSTDDSTSDSHSATPSDVFCEPSVNRHSMTGPPRARASTLRAISAHTGSSTLPSPMPPTGGASSKLPRGQLLIRPIAFPHIRSSLGVEVCSVVGGNTAVSPLMLTPERIHAGVVHVYMEARSETSTTDAESNRSTPTSISSPSNITVTDVSVSTSGIVRGRFVIYNSMTSRASSRAGRSMSSGKVTVVLGHQTKNTLTSSFIPPHQRAHFTFHPARTHIPPNDRKVIHFQCHVRTLGHQTHGILVRDVTHDIDMVLPVTFTAKMPTFLHTIDCKDGEFDAGLIYALQTDARYLSNFPSSPLPSPSPSPALPNSLAPLTSPDSRFSKVVSFRLENVRSFPLEVFIRCNLSSELHVFDGEQQAQSRRCLTCKSEGKCVGVEDESKEWQQVDEKEEDLSNQSSIILEPHSSRTLLLAFSPLLSTLAHLNGEYRLFAAGLSFAVYAYHRPSSIAASSDSASRRTSPIRSIHSTRSHTQRNSVRFIPEELNEDIVEYSINTSEDDTGLTVSDSDSNSISSMDDEPIGQVTGMDLGTPTPSLVHRRLDEVNVRVRARIGISAIKIEPVESMEVQSTSVGPSPLLRQFNQLHPRVSTIDFFTLAHTLSHLPVHPPLQYTIRIKNCSSFLPMCYRLVTSSAHVVVSSEVGRLAPANTNKTDESKQEKDDDTKEVTEDDASSCLITLTLSCPIAGLYQEWVSIYVAHQSTMVYRGSCQSSTCAPDPPSLDDGAVDLIDVREELLHTVFLRSFIQSDSIDVELPRLALPDGSITQHRHLNLGSIYVMPQPSNSPSCLRSPKNTSLTLGSPILTSRPYPVPNLSYVPLAPSRKDARHRLLEAALNPNQPSLNGMTSSLANDTPGQSFPLLSFDRQLSLSPLVLPTSMQATKDGTLDHGLLPPSLHVKAPSAARALHTVSVVNAIPDSTPMVNSSMTIRSVDSLHRSFAIRNTSQQTQWIWLRSDSESSLQVQWSSTPIITNMDDDTIDEIQLCSCGFVHESTFVAPTVQQQSDGGIALCYPSEAELIRNDSLDSLSPESEELMSHRMRGDSSGVIIDDDTVSSDLTLRPPPSLYINARVSSTGSLLSETPSGLPSMSPIDGRMASMPSIPSQTPRTRAHTNEDAFFERVHSFDDTNLADDLLPMNDDLNTNTSNTTFDCASSLPPPNYCGTISPDTHGAACNYFQQFGYESHPCVPPSLLLHPCCHTIYQLPPNRQVFAHITFSLDDHQLTPAQSFKLMNGERIHWHSLLTVRTHPMPSTVIDPSSPPSTSCPVSSNGAFESFDCSTSVAIRISAELASSQSAWELDSSIPTSTTISSLVDVPTPYSGFIAESFTVHVLQFGKLSADAETITLIHELKNRSDIDLHIRVMQATLPDYITLQLVNDTTNGEEEVPSGESNSSTSSSAHPSASPSPSVQLVADSHMIELILPPFGSTHIRFMVDPRQMPIGPFNFHFPIFNPKQPLTNHMVLGCRGEVVAPMSASAINTTSTNAGSLHKGGAD